MSFAKPDYQQLSDKFRDRHQVLAYDNTVQPEVQPFIDFIKLIPSKQNFRLYDVVIVDWRSPDTKRWLFDNVFMDEHPFRFASVFAPIHILFFADMQKKEHFFKFDDAMGQETHESFSKAVQLDIGVALGSVCAFALSQGYDPSFLQCSFGPRSPNELVSSIHKNKFVCSILIGKGIIRTDTVKINLDMCQKLIVNNKEKLFMPDLWNLDDKHQPFFDDKKVLWFKGDNYLENHVECYADSGRSIS